MLRLTRALPIVFLCAPCVGQCSGVLLEGSRTSDQFGHAIDAEANQFLVGAPGESFTRVASFEGAAYVYTRGGGTWQRTPITPTPHLPDAFFGTSVAIDGDRIAVGAPGSLSRCLSGSSSAQPGTVYVFERTSQGQWVQTARLQDVTPQIGDFFGWSVALEGDRLLVGSPRECIWGGDGVVVAYEHTPTGWVQRQRLVVPGVGNSRGFGNRIALDGDTALIGQTWFIPTTAHQVHFWVERNGTWTLQSTIPTEGDGGLVVRGNLAAIGAPDELAAAAPMPSPGNGAVYIFERTTPSSPFTHVQRIQAHVDSSTLSWPAQFGQSVALTDRRLIVGARSDRGVASFEGSVWFYDQVRAGRARFFPACKGVPSPSWGHVEFLGNAVALTNDMALGGAPYSGAGTRLAGCVVGFPLPAPIDFSCSHSAIPLASTATLDMGLRAGPNHANELYVILGSVTGTSPGVPLGSFHLNLNPDPYTNFLLGTPNTLIQSSLGQLDAQGEAFATLSYPGLPAVPAFIGLRIHHAFLAMDPMTLAGTYVSRTEVVQLF